MSTTSDESGLTSIDATQFQSQLVRLAEVLAQKVLREAAKILPRPETALDMHVLIRKAMSTFHATGRSVVDVGEKNMEGRHVGLDFL